MEERNSSRVRGSDNGQIPTTSKLEMGSAGDKDLGFFSGIGEKIGE